MTRLVPLFIFLLLLPAASVLGGDLPQVLQPNTTAYSASEIAALTQAITSLQQALIQSPLASRRYFSASEWSSRDFALYTAGVLSGKGYETVLVSVDGWPDGVHTWVLVGIPLGSKTAWIPVEATPEKGHSQQILGSIPITTDASGKVWYDTHYVNFDTMIDLPPNIPPAAKIRPPAPPIVIDMPVTLMAVGSYDPDGTIVLYQWEFCDGVHVTTSVGIVHHTFGDAGNCIVELTVIDSLGKSGITSLKIRFISGEAERSAPSGCGCGG